MYLEISPLRILIIMEIVSTCVYLIFRDSFMGYDGWMTRKYVFFVIPYDIFLSDCRLLRALLCSPGDNFDFFDTLCVSKNYHGFPNFEFRNSLPA